MIVSSSHTVLLLVVVVVVFADEDVVDILVIDVLYCYQRTRDAYT